MSTRKNNEKNGESSRRKDLKRNFGEWTKGNKNTSMKKYLDTIGLKEGTSFELSENFNHNRSSFHNTNKQYGNFEINNKPIITKNLENNLSQNIVLEKNENIIIENSSNQNIINKIKKYFLSFFLLPPNIIIQPQILLNSQEGDSHKDIEDEKKFIRDIIHYNSNNNKYLSEKNNNKFQRTVFIMLKNKEFQKKMFGSSLDKTIHNINYDLDSLNINESAILNSVINKFSPSNNKNISQEKIYNLKKNNSALLFNFLENIYFCEVLVQLFGSDKNNKISVDNTTYDIYYSTLFEDIKGVDFIITEGEKIVGVDVKSYIHKQNIFKKIPGYDSVGIFTYNQSFKESFVKFITDYNSYILTDGKKPSIKLDNKTAKTLKNDFSIFLTTHFQKNIFSEQDLNKDSND